MLKTKPTSKSTPRPLTPAELAAVAGGPMIGGKGGTA